MTITVQDAVTATPHLNHALKTLARIDLPDAWIGAGCVRDAVLDLAHARVPQIPRDIDVAYFDPADPDGAREPAFERKLAALAPGFAWEVRNQARMHARHGHRPYANTAQAIAHWVETVTAVAARYHPDGSLEILAPHGTHDLEHLLLRPVPSQLPAASAFYDRLARKGWLTRWPELKLAPGLRTPAA